MGWCHGLPQQVTKHHTAAHQSPSSGMGEWMGGGRGKICVLRKRQFNSTQMEGK